MKKLAVVFPGIGYHKDKPLLYYSSRLVKNEGYEIIDVSYHDLPEKIRGDQEKMMLSAKIAYGQTEEQLASVDFGAYDEIIFIGKSIGTVMLTRYVSEHGIKAKQIWYTPVEATLDLYPGDVKGVDSSGSGNSSSDPSDVIMFIGDDDPWSDVDRVKKKSDEKGVRWFSYPGCNHSLECNDVERNIEIISEVMKKTAEFIDSTQVS